MTLPPVVAAAAQDEEAWEDPEPLGRQHETQEFPLQVMPEPYRSFIAETAEELQVPVALPAAGVLGALAAVAGGRVEVNPYGNWTEPLNLMIAPTLGVGERKSATFKEVFAPLEDIERRLHQEALPEVAAALVERDTLESRLKAVKKQTANADSPETAAATMAEAVALANELADFEIPRASRLLADDATPEALATLLAENDGRIAVISAEGGSAFSMMEGRYTTGNGYLDLYLKGHAGETVRVDRKGRGPELIDHACLTIVVSPQPALMEKVGENLLFRGRGIVARFLYLLPESRVGFRKIAVAPVTEATRVAYQDALTTLFNRLTALDDQGNPNP